MTQILLLAMGFMSAAQAATEGKKKPMDNVEGAWIVVNEASLRKGEKWIIAAGRIREGEADQLYRFYKLAPHNTPKEIDVTIMAQPDGQPLDIVRGIYSLKSDRLTVYLVASGEKRPTAFPPEDAPLTPVLILTRQKR